MKEIKKKVAKTTSSNTGFKGVHLHGIHGKYESRFTFKGTNQYIGSYNTLGEAVRARTSFITNLI